MGLGRKEGRELRRGALQLKVREVRKDEKDTQK